MNARIAKLAILFALLLAAANSSAQMAYHYSSYDNITVNSDPSGNPVSVTVTLTLEGYTSWNFNPPAKHTGNVELVFGGVPSSNTTGPVNPNLHMNLSASVTLDFTDSCFADGGCLVAEETAYVTCTVAGGVFSGGGSSIGVSLKRVELLFTDCSPTYPTYWNAGWADPNNINCGKSDNGPPVPPGGSCVVDATTPSGAPRRCYQVNTSSCSVTFCPGPYRTMDSQCRRFYDTFHEIIVPLPAGCYQP